MNSLPVDGMTLCQPDLPHPDGIPATLRRHSLPFENEDSWHTDMMTAAQPLSIGNTVVCSDNILVQQVSYPTIERMQREIANLGIKKDVFSDFEATLTQVPKYCFPVEATRSALFVHPVPHCTLECMLTQCERIFPCGHITDPAGYYRAWTSAILHRYRNATASRGGKKLLESIRVLRRSIYPPPPRISLSERKRFAALLISTVIRHHEHGIHHDSITARTLFFRSVKQPVVLANYSGEPSPIVSDFFPPEFTEMDHLTRPYGPHMRDVLSLACITARILSGEPVAATRSFLDAPRPARAVVRDIIDRSEIGKNRITEVGDSARALLFIARRLYFITVALFSAERFPTWRKLNRATGGIWRAVPVIGPFADILFPTRCAAALRSLLHKQWFLKTFLGLQHGGSHSGAPDLAVLLSPLKSARRGTLSSYASAFDRLQGDAAKKRHTFDSVMEVNTPDAGSSRVPFTFHRRLLPLVVLTITIGYIGFHLRHVPESTPAPVRLAPVTTRDTVHTREAAADTVVAPEPPSDTGFAPEPEPESEPVKRPVKTIEKRSTGKRAVPKKPVAAKVTKKPEQPAVLKYFPLPEPEKKPVYCYLKTASVHWNLFTVRGSCGQCNLADVRIIRNSGDTIRFGNTIDSTLKYFVAHRSGVDYGPIVTAKACPGYPCVKGLFYESLDKNGAGEPVMVRPGDLVGFKYLSIHAYVVRNKKSRKKE